MSTSDITPNVDTAKAEALAEKHVPTPPKKRQGPVKAVASALVATGLLYPFSKVVEFVVEGWQSKTNEVSTERFKVSNLDQEGYPVYDDKGEITDSLGSPQGAELPGSGVGIKSVVFTQEGRHAYLAEKAIKMEQRGLDQPASGQYLA